VTKPIEPALPLSIVVLIVYIALGGWALIDAGAAVWRERDAGRPRAFLGRVLAVVGLFAAQQAVLRAVFTLPTEPLQTPRGLSILFLQSSVIAPGSFLVGHAANFGVLFLLVVGLWPRICRVAAEFGPGPWLFLCACFAFSINPESRHSNALWPVVVALACLVLDRYQWPRWFLAVFCCLSFLNSRVWVAFNAAFPELYFANFPLTMHPMWYFVQAFGFTVLAAYLHLAWRSGVTERSEA
jgi:hypothetical protein